MVFITHNELQGMFTGRQFYCGFRLPATEVFMPIIRRQGLIKCRRICHINHQVMVSRFGFVNAGGGYPHSLQTEFYRDRTGHDFSVCRRDDIDPGTLRC